MSSNLSINSCKCFLISVVSIMYPSALFRTSIRNSLLKYYYTSKNISIDFPNICSVFLKENFSFLYK
nr:MAG TPA: hypothetical protein [Caudoviricetes sp.]